MAYDVKVKIDLMKPIREVGFGTPLILECVGSSGTAKTYAEYDSLESVVKDGYTAGSDVYSTAELIFSQNNAPKKIAICRTTETAVAFLSDDTNISKNWRQLLVLDSTTGSEEQTSTPYEIAEKVETLTDKIYFANVATDFTAEEGKEFNFDRTVVFYYTPTTKYKLPVAALVGEAAGRLAGSFTYKNLILNGLEPLSLSNSQITAIHQKNGITFVEKAGDSVTSEGIVSSGEYIDIIDSQDYVIQQIQYNIQKLLNSSDKIPYDNNGIAMLEIAVVSVLKNAYNNGIIADNDDGEADYNVSFALRSETKAEDREERRYINGSFRFALAGAIHTVEIVGEVSI